MSLYIFYFHIYLIAKEKTKQNKTKTEKKPTYRVTKETLLTLQQLRYLQRYFTYISVTCIKKTNAIYITILTLYSMVSQVTQFIL